MRMSCQYTRTESKVVRLAWEVIAYVPVRSNASRLFGTNVEIEVTLEFRRELAGVRARDEVRDLESRFEANAFIAHSTGRKDSDLAGDRDEVWESMPVMCNAINSGGGDFLARGEALGLLLYYGSCHCFGSVTTNLEWKVDSNIEIVR